MTLAVGDHLVIKRNGLIVKPEDEAYHEYEVVKGIDAGGKEVDYVPYLEEPSSPFPSKMSSTVKLLVVE